MYMPRRRRCWSRFEGFMTIVALFGLYEISIPLAFSQAHKVFEMVGGRERVMVGLQVEVENVLK